jgi:hypothetical protein
MLGAMDIPAAAGPWVALGVALAVLVLAGAGLVVVLLRRRSRSPGSATRAFPEPRDDLAAFLEHPPGTAGAPPAGGNGWAALGPPPPAPPAAERPGDRRLGAPFLAVAGAAVAGLALLAAVAVWAFAGGSSGREREPGADRATRPASEGRPPAGDVVEAHLSFEGVVLEPHAVGITAGYPELRLTQDGSGPRARLELITWNCLAGEAPDDPAAAGCRRTVPEVAELAGADLEVTGTEEVLRIRGRFPTSTAPNGSSPSPTGRAYDVVVTIEAGDRARNGWRPAEGALELGGDRARTTGTDVAEGVNVLRYRDR